MSDFPSEEIKLKLDIVDVVSGYIKLQKAGSSFRAICPFHNEHSPSFFVSSSKQIFNCFGCGKGGDIFKFVMEMEGIEFVDALRILAKQAGVELKKVNKEEQSEKSILQDISVDAARYFYKNLHSVEGESALKYLEERGILKETMDEFKLGYALPSWDSLYNFLALKGYKNEMIEKAGLIFSSLKSGKKKYFDRFRDRIMFPISDSNGYIVGFTGRYLIPKENEGKYVNSPQTPIFDKGKILYALDKTKVEIKKEGSVVLVEGQMDVISSWQDGVKNVVASSGTALTQYQSKLLKRYSPNLKMAFDMDSAGDIATKRGIDVASQEGLNISVVRIPDGKDPADFILAHKGEFKNILESSIPIMNYYFEAALLKYNKDELNGKKKISEEILPNIKKIKNEVEKYYWLDKLSQTLNIDLKYLEEEMKNIKLEQPRTYSDKQDTKNIPELTIKKDDKIFTSLISFLIKDPSKYSLLENSKIIEIIQEDKEQIKSIVSENILLLFDFFLKCVKIGKVSEIMSEASEMEKTLLNPIMLQSEMLDDSIKIELEINFCINQIKKDILDIKRSDLHLKIREAEGKGDDESVDKHLKEQSKI
ncbi:MAG: DNA primase [Patescibacteria group bacterium]